MRRQQTHGRMIVRFGGDTARAEQNRCAHLRTFVRRQSHSPGVVLIVGSSLDKPKILTFQWGSTDTLSAIAAPVSHQDQPDQSTTNTNGIKRNLNEINKSSR